MYLLVENTPSPASSSQILYFKEQFSQIERFAYIRPTYEKLVGY